MLLGNELMLGCSGCCRLCRDGDNPQRRITLPVVTSDAAGPNGNFCRDMKLNFFFFWKASPLHVTLDQPQTGWSPQKEDSIALHSSANSVFFTRSIHALQWSRLSDRLFSRHSGVDEKGERDKCFRAHRRRRGRLKRSLFSRLLTPTLVPPTSPPNVNIPPPLTWCLPRHTIT